MFARLLFIILILPKSLFAAECTTLSLYPSKSEKNPITENFYKIVDSFKESAKVKNYPAMANLLHPAIQKKTSDKIEAFKSAFMNYGIEKAHLANNQFYLLQQTEEDSSLTAGCDTGTFRMPVGPKTQYVAILSGTSRNELVKIMLMFAPILKETQYRANKFKNIGVIYFNIQNWTHLRKDAEHYFKEAKRMASQKLPVAAWFSLEASRRILRANDYFEPTLLEDVKEFKEELPSPLEAMRTLSRYFQKKVGNWNVVEIAPAFESTGIQPGFKISVKKLEQKFKSLKSNCETLKTLVEKTWKELTWEYRGMTCLLYDSKQDLRLPAAHGTVALPWKGEKK